MANTEEVTKETLANALEFLLEYLEDVAVGSPWVEEYTSCFFCGEDRPEHYDDCAYVEASCILERYRGGRE